LPAAAQAAAPPNDDRSNATKLAPLPTQVRGTTVDATTTQKDPKICAPLDASVWYRIDGAPTGEVVLRLKAAGKLDAAIAVFRSVRSELRSVNCARTNDKGLAEVSFSAGKGDSFLILVGQRDGSDPGGFQLVAFTAEPPAGAPGDRLPTSGGQGTVNALGDRDDAWWVEMQAAQTYRINLVSPADLCVTVGVYRTQGHDFGAEVASISCSGYALYTPGLNGGGRYSSSSMPTRTSKAAARRGTACKRASPGVTTWGRGCRSETISASRASSRPSASTSKTSIGSTSHVRAISLSASPPPAEHTSTSSC